jgi:hypothetical protein
MDDYCELKTELARSQFELSAMAEEHRKVALELAAARERIRLIAETQDDAGFLSSPSPAVAEIEAVLKAAAVQLMTSEAHDGSPRAQKAWLGACSELHDAVRAHRK